MLLWPLNLCKKENQLGNLTLNIICITAAGSVFSFLTVYLKTSFFFQFAHVWHPTVRQSGKFTHYDYSLKKALVGLLGCARAYTCTPASLPALILWETPGINYGCNGSEAETTIHMFMIWYCGSRRRNRDIPLPQPQSAAAGAAFWSLITLQMLYSISSCRVGLLCRCYILLGLWRYTHHATIDGRVFVI